MRSRPPSATLTYTLFPYTALFRSLLLAPQQFAGDDFFHDFAGTTVDALDAGIDEVAADGVFLHVAVAAEELQTFVGDAPLQFGGGELDHGGGDGGELTHLVLADALIDEGAEIGRAHV